jgi:hypothetical protein
MLHLHDTLIPRLIPRWMPRRESCPRSRPAARRAAHAAVLAGVLLAAACTAPHVAAPERLAELRYGEERAAALAALDITPIPLVTWFDSSAGASRWRAEACEVEDAAQFYVLVFATERLVAVTTAEAASAMWDARFDAPNSPSVPDAAGLHTLAGDILSQRVDPAAFDFAAVNQANVDRRFDENANLVVQHLNPFFVLLLPIIIPWTPIWIGIVSEHRKEYAEFLGKVEALDGHSSVDDAIASLGPPDWRSSSAVTASAAISTTTPSAKASATPPATGPLVAPGAEVLVFHPVFVKIAKPALTLGFSGGRLSWIVWSDSRPRWTTTGKESTPKP